MPTQSERRAATRGALLGAAERLFVRDGYDQTSTQAILAEAGVSRGALYHHFEGKEALFAAVFEAVSERSIQRSTRRVLGRGSQTETLIEACLAWLAEARRPEVATILLELGPRVLGWRRARELEARFSLGLMVASLRRAVDAGEIQVPSLELSARLLNAALAEAALASLEAEPSASTALVEASVRHLVESWRAPHASDSLT